MQQSCNEAEYDDIDRNAFNTDFSDESIRESDDKFFQAMKRDENSDKIYMVLWIQKDFGMEYVNTEVLQAIPVVQGYA